MRFRTRVVRLVSAFALLAAPMAVAALVALPAGAADTTFHVTNTNDAGDGSLRKAIADAAANPGNDTVQVDVSGTITLTTGPITWNGDTAVTIHGNGITLNAGGALGAAQAAYHIYFGKDRIVPNKLDAMKGSYLGPE